ncbi:MAG: 2Fe-2S iron-sulfur cluster-binding protein [Planctomycetota bacterium]
MLHSLIAILGTVLLAVVVATLLSQAVVFARQAMVLRHMRSIAAQTAATGTDPHQPSDDKGTSANSRPPAHVDGTRGDTVRSPASIVSRTAQRSIPPWKGMQTLSVIAVQDESQDCKSFYLSRPDSSPLPLFSPGQFVRIELPIDLEPTPSVTDDNAATSQKVARSYSLSDAPHEACWRITVKRLPGGQVSTRLHDQILPGDTLRVGPPRGKFVPDMERDDPLTLIGAGIGITPMVSMAAHVLIWQPQRLVRVFYQVRNLEDAALLSDLQSLQRNHPQRFHLFISVSGATAETVFASGVAAGRMNGRQITAACRNLIGQFFICGPHAFMNEIRDTLVERGASASDVHIESFGTGRKKTNSPAITAESPSNSTTAATATETQTATKCTVRLRGQEVLVTMDPQRHASLLDALEEAGVEADSGCRAGECGVCEMRVCEGKIRHIESPAYDDLAADAALTCIAVPETPTLEIATG